MAEEKKTEKHTFTCIGLREFSKGKFVHTYLDVIGEMFAWTTSIGSTIGGRYEVEHQSGDRGRIYPSTARYVGQVENPQLLAKLDEWRLESAAARNAQEAHRAEKRAKKEASEFGDLTLKQIKEMQRGKLAHQRYGMQTAVLNYISGW